MESFIFGGHTISMFYLFSKDFKETLEIHLISILQYTFTLLETSIYVSFHLSVAQPIHRKKYSS